MMLELLRADPIGAVLCAVALLLAVAAVVLGVEALIYRKEDEETWLL